MYLTMLIHLRTEGTAWLKLDFPSLSPLWSDTKLWSWLGYLLELVVWSLLMCCTIMCFDLKLDTTKISISSRTGTCASVNR